MDLTTQILLIPIAGIPEVMPGDDLSQMVAERFPLVDGDVLVLAQKIVSKEEGRLVQLGSISASDEAKDLGRRADKDPRIAQLILDESREVLRVRPGVIIVEDRRGWVCANAGIDRSNIVQVGDDESVCLLPLDADASAARIRAEIHRRTGVLVGLVICDSHGRAWREGTVGVAIGASGIEALSDRRGDPDRQGYELQHTLVGSADEMASAASLLMGQGSESIPAVVIRGLYSGEAAGTARDLQRPRERDLFR